MNIDALARRLQALEDRQAILELKARYFACCDAKDPAGMRACFCDGPVRIEYGVVGDFERADDLVDVFRRLGCHSHMVEMHHGVNPQIELIDAQQARGRWGLHYQLINTQERSLTQLGAYYQDEYRRTAAGWRISATRCVVTSTLVLKLEPSAVQALVIGRPVAA